MLRVEPTSPPPAARAADKIPFLDLKTQAMALSDEVTKLLVEAMEGANFILGPKVEAFEKAFAQYVGAKHCVGLNSGTSALHLAMIAAGVGAGDEVITVPMTFVATTWAVSYVGARPVFVDVDPATYTMDAAKVEKAITPKTKAILPVHLYGQPADLRPLLELGKKHGIPVIEDAAQAHGAEVNGQRVGPLGLCGCFSFYPGKNLGAYGEGGALVTNDDAIAARCATLRNHAQAERYHHSEIGYNYRMDGFQGIVLGVKLRHLEGWTKARIRLATRYGEKLAGLPVALPTARADVRHVWHLFVVLHPKRDQLQAALKARGIDTGLHYPVPVHLQKAYADLGHRAGDFPVSERVGRECLSLPLFPEMTDAQQDRVIEALAEALKEVR
jgi:dTDP-4-amino-4,6-dideoxygalactose transaminase